MKNWEDIWGEIISNKEIIEEYRKAFLLNMFKKICVRMNKDVSYRDHIMTLFRQTSDYVNTTKIIIRRTYDYDLSDADAKIMWKWFDANRHKNNTRKAIPFELKKSLYEEQKGICPICSQELGDDWNKIHVDHIIPWTLVGDELDDNYQDLCESCNECKNAKIDYIFMGLLNMN